MFEILDTMIALAVIFMILSMINKFILSGVKRVLKIRFKAMADEFKDFATNNALDYLNKEDNTDDTSTNTNFLSDYTEKLKNIKLPFSKNFLLKFLKLRSLDKKTIRNMTEFKGSVEAFLKREDIGEIAGYLGIDLTVQGKKLAEAKAKAIKARDKLKASYNSTMEQVTREYTKKMRYWAFATGLLIAVTMNADFIVIYKTITENSTIRTQLVAKAEGLNERVKAQHDEVMKAIAERADKDIIREIFNSTNKNIDKLTSNFEDAGLKLGWQYEPWPGWVKGNVTIKKTNECPSTTEECLSTTKKSSTTAKEGLATGKEGLTTVKEGLDAAKTASNQEDDKPKGEWKESGPIRWFLNKVVGLLASALLIGFGAPFWHDLLTSLVGIKKVLRGKGNDTESASPSTSDKKPV